MAQEEEEEEEEEAAAAVEAVVALEAAVGMGDMDLATAWVRA
jgi:aryl-alcohol dehydrogenase-like predicted oxidoreductase